MLFGLLSLSGVGHTDAATAMPVTVLRLDASNTRPGHRTYGGRTMPARAADLGFKHAGEVEEVRVDWGDTVHAGDILARLRPESFEAVIGTASAEVAVATATLRAADADLDIARKTERRLAELKTRGHLSTQQHDEALSALRARIAQHGVAVAALQRAKAMENSARIAYDESRIIAPFDGVIQSRHLDEGAQVRPGEPVLRLIAIDAIEARFGLPEAVARDLDRNSSFEVLWQGTALPASLVAVLPEVDPASRTISTVFRLTGTQVPAGAVVELRLAHQLETKGFWVPLGALIEAERGLWSVYVVGADERVERRLVEVVHSEADDAFVRGTIASGDRLISAGANRVVPGQRVITAPAASINGSPAS